MWATWFLRSRCPCTSNQASPICFQMLMNFAARSWTRDVKDKLQARNGTEFTKDIWMGYLLLNTQSELAFVSDLNQQKCPKGDGLTLAAFPVIFVFFGFQKLMFQHQHFAVDTPCLLWVQWLMWHEVRSFSEVSIPQVSCISLHAVTFPFELMNFQLPCLHGL